MASTRFSRIVIIGSLLLGIFAFPKQAEAAPALKAGDNTYIREHVIKFYMSSTLMADQEFAQIVLPKYVADMNVILQKNTDRRLVFDPTKDIIITDTQPQTNYATPPLPLEGFDIWANVMQSDRSVSYGGYAGVDQSGAGVLGGLKWTKLYDPDHLSSDEEVADYWIQINNMLHELAHVFGAGIGEYYKLSLIQDTTGIPPLLKINVFDTQDSFWSNKRDFLRDPLLLNPVQAFPTQFRDRESLLDYVQYSDLTAAILNGDYRNSLPSVDLSDITIKVTTKDGTPIPSANIKIWSVMGSSPYSTQLLADTYTDNEGVLSFGWGTSNNPHNSNDFLRLVKVYKDGYEAYAFYISIYDLDMQRLLNKTDHFESSIQLESTVPLSIESTFIDVSTNNFAWSSIEKLYAKGITGGCTSTPLQFCPDQVVTRAQMAIFLERSTKGPDFIPPIFNSTFKDISGHWAQAWIETLASDGITSGCENESFCPDNEVTRAQMAVFILRAKYGAQYIPATASGNMFEDIPANYWAANWVEELGKEGITSGCGNSNYCPDTPVTRAQMAVFLDRAFPFP